MQPSTGNGAPKDPRHRDVAVYIDYENLYISLRSTVGQNPQFDVIMDKCREFGRVTIARAYADWSEFARVVTSQMFSSGVEPIYVPTRKFYDAKTRSQATKNSVDIHITIDIMKDVLSTKNIDIFVLVSGDRDFVPLMNQIRAAGKEVYAIGVAGCTSSELAVAVDEMFYYHQLLENEEDLAAEHRDIYGKLVRAIEIARARGYRTTLGVIKPIMRETVVGFDERKFRNAKGVPFQKFKNFAQEAEKNGFIRVVDVGGAIELALVSEDAAKIKRLAEEEREAQRLRAQAQAQARRTPPPEGTEAESAEADIAAGGGGGRRRGRRGGRRRRRGPGEGVAVGAAQETGSDEAEDGGAEETEGNGEDVEVQEREEARPAPPERMRAAERPSFDEDEDDDDLDEGDVPLGNVVLPNEGLTDLKAVGSPGTELEFAL